MIVLKKKGGGEEKYSITIEKSTGTILFFGEIGYVCYVRAKLESKNQKGDHACLKPKERVVFNKCIIHEFFSRSFFPFPATMPSHWQSLHQNVSSRMFLFIFTTVGLYSDGSSRSSPAVSRILSTMRLLASRAGPHPVSTSTPF